MHTHIHSYTYTHIYPYTHTLIHTYTHMHTDTHKHTHKEKHHNYVPLCENNTQHQRSVRNLRAKRAEYLGVHEIATHNCIAKKKPRGIKIMWRQAKIPLRVSEVLEICERSEQNFQYLYIYQKLCSLRSQISSILLTPSGDFA